MDKEFEIKELQNDMMICDNSYNEVHVLNKTAKLIYKLCKDGKGHEEIEVTLKNNFPRDIKGNIREDVHVCITDLKAKGLISV